ncbi:MAG TPA: heme ABC exporter ATP-binding protein CcmA [Allosphingosinicella sp.]|nr:heme ABC exporter ATP-binding protein CcmA [Allosphingosinicella sp.]
MSLLRLDRVACVRGGRLLFENLSLDLAEGGAALVTGPNGVGKSSLIRLAAGLLRQSAGSIERGCRAGLADDALALDERVSLERALAFWARLDRSRVGPGMEALGLSHLASVPVRMLSTGQRKRAALARVACSGAMLWLLDEPANGLDAEGVERLDALIAAHRGRGGALLAASHLPLRLEGAHRVDLA